MRANAGIYLRTMMLVCVAWTVLLGLIAPAAAQPVAAVTEYYHADALGSTRTVTDQSGAVVRRYDYAPFGEQDSPCTASADRRLFTGQPRDRETCLDYFGARHYRSTLGRFLTIDPALDISAALVDPQRWNRYSYARNNPTKFVDPDGREIAVFYGGRIIGAGLETVAASQANGNVELAKAAALVAVTGLLSSGGSLLAALGRGAFGLCVANPSTCIGTPINLLEGSTGAPPTLGSTASVGAQRVSEVAGIVFKTQHASRHLGSALTAETVETAIASSLGHKIQNLGLATNLRGRVQVGEFTVEYRAFRRLDGVVNVGTYYIID